MHRNSAAGDLRPVLAFALEDFPGQIKFEAAWKGWRTPRSFAGPRPCLRNKSDMNHFVNPTSTTCVNCLLPRSPLAGPRQPEG
jgi:hypothetical protein